MNDERDNSIDADVEVIRRAHARLEKEQPGETVDATIRRAAHAPRRISRRWTAGITTAASIALAVILLPQLLVEQPAREHRADRMETATETMAPPPVPIAALDTERDARTRQLVQEERAARTRQEDSSEHSARRSLARQAPLHDNRLRTLRTQLEGADAGIWREKLVELHNQGEAALAEELLKDFKRQFDVPEETTLETLAADRNSAH